MRHSAEISGRADVAGKPTQPSASQATNDEAAIRALEAQAVAALLNHDFAALERLWSEQLLVNAVVNRVVARSVELNVHRRGVAQYSSFEPHIEQIRFHGDVAVVMGAETVRYTGNSRLAGQTAQRRFTHVWRREDGTWCLIAPRQQHDPGAHDGGRGAVTGRAWGGAKTW